jgi:hypothetical protein
MRLLHDLSMSTLIGIDIQHFPTDQCLRWKLRTSLFASVTRRECRSCHKVHPKTVSLKPSASTTDRPSSRCPGATTTFSPSYSG